MGFNEFLKGIKQAFWKKNSGSGLNIILNTQNKGAKNIRFAITTIFEYTFAK